MYKALLLVAVIYCITNPILSQNDVEKKISDAQKLFYNLDWEAATKIYKQTINKNSDQLSGYVGIAEIFATAFIGAQKNEDYNSFIYWYDLTLEKVNDNNLATRIGALNAYQLGKLYLLKSIVEASHRSYFKAFLAIKSASNYYEKSLKFNSNFFDSYKGIGIVQFFLDFLPPVAKWALPLAGLEADKERGFQNIKTAYYKGKLDKHERSLSLAQIYADYVAEYDSAETVLKEVVNELPDHPVFNFYFAVIQLKKGNLSEAEKYLDKVLELNHPKFTLYNNLSQFLKGDIFFKRNDFQNSIVFLERFLNSTRNNDYKGITNYRLAIAYRVLGQTSKMNLSLFNAKNGNEDIYDDRISMEKCKAFLKNGISPNEIGLVLIQNKIASGDFKDAYLDLKKMLSEEKPTEVKVKVFILLADAALKQNMFFEALNYAKQAQSLNNEFESWIKPFCWYIIASSSFEIGNISESKLYVSKYKNSDEYQFDNILYGQINKLERRIKSNANGLQKK